VVRVALLILGAVLGSACTPEALVVDPETGGSSSASGSSGASGGAGSPDKGGSSSDAGSDTSGAGEPSTPECAELTSPRAGCAACLAKECPTEVAGCKDTACLCGDAGDSTGEFNCLLACPTVKPEMDKVDACAQQCGFGKLGQSAPATHALFDCAVDAPNGGPPVCPVCFGLPQ
jgi:hypothetical protein